MLFASDRRRVLLHCFKQRSLSFRWCSVDLICQQNVGKNRTGYKAPATLTIVVIFDDIGTGDIRWHEIWSELDAIKLQSQRICQCANQQCFGSTWHTGNQTVATHQQSDQQVLHDFVLTHNHATDFAAQVLSYIPELCNQLRRVGIIENSLTHSHSPAESRSSNCWAGR